MKTLIDAIIIGTIGIIAIFAVNHSQDEILQKIKNLALTKARQDLVSMESIAKSLTSRKYSKKVGSK